MLPLLLRLDVPREVAGAAAAAHVGRAVSYYGPGQVLVERERRALVCRVGVAGAASARVEVAVAAAGGAGGRVGGHRGHGGRDAGGWCGEWCAGHVAGATPAGEDIGVLSHRWVRLVHNDPVETHCGWCCVIARVAWS